MSATMQLPLSGMHAAITGAGRGIGRAIAERLAGMGASLTLLGRDATRLEDTAKAMCPGYTETDLMTESIATIVRKTHRMEKDVRAMFAQRNPQQRVLAPQEVASTVAWLCLPESQAITGQAIAVCGGEVMTG